MANLDSKYAKLLKEDFYGIMLSAHGVVKGKIKDASTDKIQNGLYQTLQSHQAFNRDNPEEFKKFFRQSLSTEYKLAGLASKL